MREHIHRASNHRLPLRPVVLAVAVLLTGLAGVARAQAPAPPPPPPPPRHEGSVDFSFVGTAGNSSTQTIGLGGQFIVRRAPWEAKLKVDFVRNEADDAVTAQSATIDFRAQRPVSKRLSAYGQYGYQRDRFAGIIDRNAVEGGVAYSMKSGPQALTLDAGLGYANEQRLPGPNLSTATLGFGGVYTIKLSATSDLSEDAHVVCSLSDGSDWRVANALALTAKLTTVLALKASTTIRYVNLPVAGFKKTDGVTAIALVAKF